MTEQRENPAVSVSQLRTEYRVNPLGIDARHPRLSWQIVSSRRGVKQKAYHVRVEDETGTTWDTGRVESAQSIHVPYEGPSLHSGQRCTWQVEIWDESDRPSGWSETAHWEMGLLEPTDWRAKWIDPEGEIDPGAFKPCPYLRREFTLAVMPIRRARAYATCHGVYEMSLNGQVVGDQVLTPGFTSYHERLQYQVYDVGALLRPGANAVGAILGDGWWRGKTDALSHRNVYGERLALLVQIHIVYADGSEQWVLTDESWKTATGPILKSDLKDGEIYDARLEMPGWDAPGFKDQSWRPVRVVDFGFDNLIASNGPPIRRMETFTPEIIHTPGGKVILDLGQNIAGRLRFRVQGEAGTTVRLKHGETLGKDGEFTMDNLNPSGLIPLLFKVDPLLQEVRYTLKGAGVEEFESRFTFQGFRYALVEGWPGEPKPEDFTGIAIYSDMRPTGSFQCSHPLVNRLHKNIEWSFKGNYLDIPTDCPQRERSGWAGDAQVFTRTGCFLMETSGFFAKWLADLAADQRQDGVVPNVIPDASRYVDAGIIGMTNGSSGFGDASVIIPWTVYRYFGDVGIIARQYASMKKWVDHAEERARDLRWSTRLMPAHWFGVPEHYHSIWDDGYHWGEWQTPDQNPFLAMLINALFGRPSVATAFLAYSAGLVAEAARVLGHEDDARHYANLSAKVREAWQKAFVKPNGRLQPDRQETYVRALAFNLLPDAQRPAAAARLVDLIERADDHLTTGFMSSSFLCHVLTEYGYLDVAYRLLEQTEPPSWLYPVTKGATTIWEFWQVIRPDNKVTLGSMNHYSHGSVGAWLYQVVAGIEAIEPGYRHVLIQPHPGGSLTHARAAYQSLYGEIESAWRIGNGQITLNVSIPPNTTATIRLPRAAGETVTESGRSVDLQADGRDAKLEVGAGRYEFAYPWRTS